MCGTAQLLAMAATDRAALERRLGPRYRIERELGRGGMGTVYLARELQLDRAVALKVLPPAFANDHALRERFVREMRTAASFSHPNIVPVFAVEDHDDVLAFAMGYVEGESLAERVARTGPLTAREAVRLMLDVAWALAYAHGRDVVHRDIKPENIMLERATNRALVMDFGVARRTDGPAAADGLTRVGEVVGTPEYMSPEQATGDIVDGRSDLYSLALVLWFALTGQVAMGGDTAPRVLVRQLTEMLPPIASVRPDLPRALAEAIDRCLAKNPVDRFADAGALAQALDDAALAAPDVPLPIRLIARDLRLHSLALPMAAVLAAAAMLRTFDGGLQNIDPLIPWVVLLAVLVARVVQSLGDLERLVRRGFSADDVERGLEQLVREEESARAAARLDADLAIDRRRSRRTALVMFVVAVASVAIALALRVEVGPRQYQSSFLGIMFLFNGLACLGVTFVLLLRDPRRTPLGERLFRVFWLRAPGRSLIRRVMRDVPSPGGSPTPFTTTPAVWSPTPVGALRTPPAVVTRDEAPRGEGPTIAALEQRVAALEVWREAQDGSNRPSSG